MLTQEEDDIPNGWPLGLENMNMKLRSPEHIQTRTIALEHTSFRVPSSGFSSFSSSNLDTESSASFFQDHSVSLGRLIGIRYGDGRGGRGRLYFPNAVHGPDEQRLLNSDDSLDNEIRSTEREIDMSCRICMPQLCNIMSRSSKNSRRQ